VRCIAKGKDAKKYEFGNKSSIAKTVKSGIIVGAKEFTGNPYDADTLDPQLRQIEKLTGRLPKIAILDRGYRVKKNVLGTEIKTPGKLTADASNYQKQKTRKYFRARASGTRGNAINTLLAAAGFNMMKMLRRIKAKTICLGRSLIDAFENYINANISIWKNQWVFQA
jgi:IS5 family transposase